MKNNLLVIIFIVIIFLYINKNNIEKMTEINTEKKLLEEYKKDIDSIRSLATIANQLQSENGLTLPGIVNPPFCNLSAIADKFFIESMSMSD